MGNHVRKARMQLLPFDDNCYYHRCVYGCFGAKLGLFGLSCSQFIRRFVGMQYGLTLDRSVGHPHLTGSDRNKAASPVSESKERHLCQTLFFVHKIAPRFNMVDHSALFTDKNASVVQTSSMNNYNVVITASAYTAPMRTGMAHDH